MSTEPQLNYDEILARCDESIVRRFNRGQIGRIELPGVPFDYCANQCLLGKAESLDELRQVWEAGRQVAEKYDDITRCFALLVHLGNRPDARDGLTSPLAELVSRFCHDEFARLHH